MFKYLTKNCALITFKYTPNSFLKRTQQTVEHRAIVMHIVKIFRKYQCWNLAMKKCVGRMADAMSSFLCRHCSVMSGHWRSVRCHGCSLNKLIGIGPFRSYPFFSHVKGVQQSNLNLKVISNHAIFCRKRSQSELNALLQLTLMTWINVSCIAISFVSRRGLRNGCWSQDSEKKMLLLKVLQSMCT